MTSIQNDMTNQRLRYIDTAKALGILAVIWGHTMQVGWSNSVVYAFHIPLFFFISGWLFNNAKYTSVVQLLRSRWKRLIVPYFIYSFIIYFFWAIGGLIGGKTPVHDYWFYFYEIFIAQGSGGFLLLYPMWFVPCLLFVEVVYFYLAKLPDWLNSLCSCLLAAGTAVLLYTSVLPFDLRLAPWSIDSAMLALPFYALGNLSRKHQAEQWLMRSSRGMLWGVWFISTAIMVAVALWQGKVSMGHADLGARPYVFYGGAVAGIIAVMTFCFLINDCLKDHPFMHRLNWLGVQSYDIMATHVPLKCAMMALVAWIAGSSVGQASENILLSLATFVLTVPAVILLVWGIDKIRSRKA